MRLDVVGLVTSIAPRHLVTLAERLVTRWSLPSRAPLPSSRGCDLILRGCGGTSDFPISGRS
jgi:hypothetical protein